MLGVVGVGVGVGVAVTRGSNFGGCSFVSTTFLFCWFVIGTCQTMDEWIILMLSVCGMDTILLLFCQQVLVPVLLDTPLPLDLGLVSVSFVWIPYNGYRTFGWLGSKRLRLDSEHCGPFSGYWLDRARRALDVRSMNTTSVWSGAVLDASGKMVRVTWFHCYYDFCFVSLVLT